MQKNRFATYLSMALSLVGLVLLLALPFVNMQGVRSFSFFGLLSGSGGDCPAAFEEKGLGRDRCAPRRDLGLGGL